MATPTCVQSKIAEITAKLQPRFRPENYGYAGAIAIGKVAVKEQSISLNTPPLATDSSPLPFFSCESASALATRDLTKEGLQCAMAKIAIPVMPVEEGGFMVHKICLISDRDTPYVAGLAQPVDNFLGLFPFKKVSKVPWIIGYLDKQGYNPFLNSPDVPIYEIPAWQLSTIDPLIKPLKAKITNGDKLGLAELGLGIGRSELYVGLVARILSFDRHNDYALLEWNLNLFIKIPLNILDQIAKGLYQLRNNLADVIELLMARGMVDLEERITNDSLKEEGISLLHESWPAVAQFLAKLPAEDIQAVVI